MSEMVRTLQKKFRFETAHRLAKGYVGKCANIHGHSWNGHIEVEYLEMDEFDMGVDYAILGRYCKILEAELDHKLILWEGDEDLIKSLQAQGQVVVTTRKNPTSEALADLIFRQVDAMIKDELVKLNKGVIYRLKSVTIEETCTTRCTVTRDNLK